MKYKVGDKIKIIEGTIGCLGARGKIGIVTNKKATTDWEMEGKGSM